jgi:hypothetical protein
MLRNTKLRNGRSKFDAALMCLRPCVCDIVEDHRELVTINNGRPLQEADWSERNIVSITLHTSLHI